MIYKGPRREIQHKILPRPFWAVSPRDPVPFQSCSYGGGWQRANTEGSKRLQYSQQVSEADKHSAD